jgi:hypothetical protein
VQAGDGRPSYDELAALIAQQAATIARLQAEVAALRAENAELKRRLGMNSRNSSKPPSSDSPSTKPAPKSLAEHPLAARRDVSLDDLADQPFIALPAAGPARRFWLAADRWDAPPTVVAEAQTAEETFEAVPPASAWHGGVQRWRTRPSTAAFVFSSKTMSG